MLKSAEWRETMLVHPVQSCGPIPTVADEDGIYPYPSFAETARRPQLRSLRMISVENEWMKVTVCPDLGGKVQSIFDKACGKEVLFDSGTVRPVRILPRMAFISGGIEVSFPIAHTPVQLEAVHASVERIGDRLYVWCGEREIRYGMHWTVEYSLGEDDWYLTQRTLFVNPGFSGTHAWMSWSNAALPARPDSLFHFPSGRVLRHADVLEEVAWEREREYRLSDFDRMQGFFWRSADCNAFGMFTPSLGSGLYHIAEPAEAPGIKLWLYGLGRHEEWAWATAARRESYAEIQAGPLLEQADNNTLAPGERHMHTEFWIPSGRPLDIAALRLPKPKLVAGERIPLFGWAPRESLAVWIRLEEAYAAGDPEELAVLEAPSVEDCNWPPSGMERLGDALQWAERVWVESGNESERLLWRYYYGVWLAGRGELEAAIGVLETVDADWSFALLGRLYRAVRGDHEASLAAYRRIRSAAWSLHPQVFAERDVTLSFFGAAAFAERADWFERVASLQDDVLAERRAYFLFEKGDVLEAKALLERTPFEKVHQRYARSGLWRRIADALGDAGAQGDADGTAVVPAHLGEDDLAVYGAYRVTDAKQAHE